MPSLAVTVERVVEFAETDAAGLLHFSNYLRYVEGAERVLFDSLAWPLLADDGATLSGFPRARVQCDYRAPLRFGDRVRITLELKEVGGGSLRYAFRIERIGDTPPVLAASGEMTTVHARLDRSTGRIEAVLLPGPLRIALLAGAPHPNAPKASEKV